MSVIAAQLGTALEQHQLEETAKAVEPLAATDRVRTALLSAVGHDLRRPLAAATAAVSGLRSEWSKLSDQDRADLLETADEALSQLANLVTDLLDVSRLQSGVLGVSVMPVDPAEVIIRRWTSCPWGRPTSRSTWVLTFPRWSPTQPCCSELSSTCCRMRCVTSRRAAGCGWRRVASPTRWRFESSITARGFQRTVATMSWCLSSGWVIRIPA
ncbi:osmosensitive K+ channel histidine kinase KdpD [Cutibacterium acnes JCM 18916]|nr:osmosensitive K+ channel histidine kinase KdpD [Cutibacterium acnes JCM 18916]